MLSESFAEFNEESQLLIVKFIGAYTLAAHANNVPQLPTDMLKLLSQALNLLSTSIGPVLRSCVYSLIGKRLYFKKIILVEKN